MRVSVRGRMGAGGVAACAAVLALGVTAAPASAAKAAKVTIKRTTGGIPNITSENYFGAGYGYGFVFAEDNICEMANDYVTVRADRARYFGPDEDYASRGNGATINNLDSDFFYQRIIDTGKVEELMDRPPPIGPLPGLQKVVRGYVAGYNAYLRKTGVDGITDPACRGAEWVKPITELDAYRRFYQLGLLASQTVAVDGIATAAPPTPAVGREEGEAAAEVSPAEEEMLGELDAAMNESTLGSNAYGLGKEATQNGRGMVLGNPHFPWFGTERFYQAHVRVPGKLNVSGASLFGVPAVLIGHTRKLAWSHTVSTAFRFTPFELRLVPGSPTTYLVDGQPRQMTSDEVTVDVRQADGSLAEETRTLWNTEYGPVFTSLLGLPLFPWTPTTAYAMGDVNAENLRYLNHFFETDRARSTKELHEILRTYQGIPWVNTIAADSKGKALYADIGAIPAVPNSKTASCNTALGVAATNLLGLPVLDGSRSECNWDSDPDAVAPGTFGPSHEPHLFRDDYVTNSNDSYWLSNPEQPLEGFARIIGDERTESSLRTRLGLLMVQQRIAGTDEYEGRGFTRQQLQDVVFNNRQYAGELWQDELVAMCEANPSLTGTSGPVDVSEACPVLAAWDGRDDLDSKGAILFRRFASRALGSPAPAGGPPASPYSTPFSPADAVNTPNGLNSSSPAVRAALADAVDDLRGAGIPLDAALRDYQFTVRGDEKIPIHGGPGDPIGVFNAISAPWNGSGFREVQHGSSIVMVTSFTDGCPDDRSILTYSLSTNPRSPYYADQTRMFSAKEWVDPPFCAGEVRKAKAVEKVKRLRPRR
ncbi:MAG TPA: penicillin acylase family protein [Solirubrobacterales bacterium]